MVNRFDTPLYTVGESARYLDVPAGTFHNWAHGYRHRRAGDRMVSGPPVLMTLPRSGPGRPIVPFAGLAEGYVLTAIRRSGAALGGTDNFEIDRQVLAQVRETDETRQSGRAWVRNGGPCNAPGRRCPGSNHDDYVMSPHRAGTGTRPAEALDAGTSETGSVEARSRDGRTNSRGAAGRYSQQAANSMVTRTAST